MPLALLMLGQSATDLVATARLRTAAEQRCVPADVTDVTVCGRRNADRFRPPFATRAADRRDDVAAERAALLHRTNPVQDLSPFLVESGMAGITAGITFGASGSGMRVRPGAP